MNRQQFLKINNKQVQEKLLIQLLHSDSPVFFDIGACEGENSIRYSNFFPNAKIYTFEPLPKNFAIIENSITNNKISNIFPQQLCLSDKIGEATFYVSSGKPENAIDSDWDYGNKSSSLLAPEKTKEVHTWLKFNETITVETSTLKQFCKTNQIPKIDFIHMDVQGAELMVLKGAENFIKNINMIWLEVEAVELYKAQPLKNDVEQFMLDNNFTKIKDTVYNEAGDQFWVNKNYINNNNLHNKIKYFKFINIINFYYKKLKYKFI